MILWIFELNNFYAFISHKLQFPPGASFSFFLFSKKTMLVGKGQGSTGFGGGFLQEKLVILLAAKVSA
jgi:hypothetical protein